MLGDNSGHIEDPLPYDYQVEYLESTGTQYIDTGTLSYDDLRIESKWHLSSVDGTVFYGIRRNQSTISAGGSIRPTGYARWGSTAYISIISFGDLEIIQDASGINVNGIRYRYSAREIVLPDEGHTMFLFAWRNASDNASGFTKAKCYYYKVYKNNTLIQDLIPVVKDRVPCMYDKVTKTFFYNQGTGSFIAGPRVGGVHIVWNQIINNNDFTNSENVSVWGFNRVTKSFNDNSMELSYDGNVSIGSALKPLQDAVVGHKYFALYMIKALTPTNCGTGYGGQYKTLIWQVDTSWNVYGYILTAKSIDKHVYVYVNLGNGNKVNVQYVTLFDLTQMFGEGNEPTSVAQFQQWFTDNIGPLDTYYPYNKGEEIKVKYLPKDM